MVYWPPRTARTLTSETAASSHPRPPRRWCCKKLLISEETDLIEPTLLDELICHIASLASVYHKPPKAFVEGKVGLKRVLPAWTQKVVCGKNKFSKNSCDNKKQVASNLI